jgi:hypothetical protein
LLALLSLGNIPQKSTTPHVDTALTYVGTMEATGHNDGPVVEKFLHSVGRHKGDSWCAAFASYCMQAAHVKAPTLKSGMAQAYFNKKSIKTNDVLIGKKKITKGYLVIWKHGNTMSGHIGIVTGDWTNKSGPTVEGNTSGPTGSQWDGGGVYKKIRYLQPANAFRIIGFSEVTY